MTLDMSIVATLHNPQQDPRCLYGMLLRAADWAVEDAERFRAFGNWPNFLIWLRSVPHLEDIGGPICGSWCCPIQRENKWPERMNCWERTQHALAASAHLLPEGYHITVWDREIPYTDSNGNEAKGRHVSILQFDTSYNSQKPLVPWVTGVLPEPTLYLDANYAANYDEAEARKWGAVSLDAAGGLLGAVTGYFGGQQSGTMVASAIKSINDNLVRPGGTVLTSTGQVSPTAPYTLPLELQHSIGISPTTLAVGAGVAVLGTALVISLMRRKD